MPITKKKRLYLADSTAPCTRRRANATTSLARSHVVTLKHPVTVHQDKAGRAVNYNISAVVPSPLFPADSRCHSNLASCRESREAVCGRSTSARKFSTSGTCAVRTRYPAMPVTPRLSDKWLMLASIDSDASYNSDLPFSHFRTLRSAFVVMLE